MCLSLCRCTHHSYCTILCCYDLIVDLSGILVLSSGRRSWPIMMASRRSLCPRGLHILVYRVVVPCYDFLSSWSTTFITCLGVGCHWVWCDQHCLRLCCEVVHLRCQLCISHDSHIAVLFTPVKYVRVPQFVGVFPDMGTTYLYITGLNVIQREESLVFLAHMSHTEVCRRAVLSSCCHHVQH